MKNIETLTSESKLPSQACLLSTCLQACAALKAVKSSEEAWLAKKATRGRDAVEGDRGRRTHTYRIITWPCFWSHSLLPATIDWAAPATMVRPSEILNQNKFFLFQAAPARPSSTRKNSKAAQPHTSMFGLQFSPLVLSLNSVLRCPVSSVFPPYWITRSAVDIYARCILMCNWNDCPLVSA